MHSTPEVQDIEGRSGTVATRKLAVRSAHLHRQSSSEAEDTAVLVRQLLAVTDGTLSGRTYPFVGVAHRVDEVVVGVTGRRNQHPFATASAATEPDVAIEELPREVQMPCMSSRFLDHVQHDPTNIRRLVSPVPPAWRRRERSCGEHGL